MKAMILKEICEINAEKELLEFSELPEPFIREKEVLVRVSACGVCHTELDEIEGRLPCVLPVVLGHQIVGRVEKLGDAVKKFKKGDRVGITWINSSCGKCYFCKNENENLCYEFKATGCNVNGGYAEYTVISEDFAFKIPEKFSDSSSAPLLCAGIIGYRALRLCNFHNGQTLGLFGFGASAHIVIQIVKYKYPDSKVFVWTKAKQEENQKLALKLGADWVGDIGVLSPQKLNCAIDFTPAWKPIVEALRNLEKGGRVVINAIRKEERDKNSLLELDYATHIWSEKEIKSVANVTRRDVEEFLALAGEISISPEVCEFPLEKANSALLSLKQGKIKGACVLII